MAEGFWGLGVLFIFRFFTHFPLIFVDAFSLKTPLQEPGIDFFFLSVSLFLKTDRLQYLAKKEEYEGRSG